MVDSPVDPEQPPKSEQEAPADSAASMRPQSRFFLRPKTLKSPSDALRPETVPTPPGPTRKKRKGGLAGVISGTFSILLVLFVFGGLGFLLFQQALKMPGPLEASKTVIIIRNSDTPIVDRLAEEGVIQNVWAFRIQTFLTSSNAKLKAGEYEFRAGISMQEVIDLLVSGHAVLHDVSIPEGYTSEMTVNKLREVQPPLDGTIRDIPADGSLMPSTYKYALGDRIDKIVQKMREDQTKLVNDIWARRATDLLLKSPYELVTLASLVEKETGRAEERPHIASVFLNRLQKGIRLQSDPTVVYGLVGGKGALGHPITRAELDRPTRYNTYQIVGLPPGPICNPGRAALEAVANPSHTSDLFFVADGTGGHIFAATLDEHNRNVARWRQIEQNVKDRLSPDLDRTVLPPRPDQHGELEQPVRDEGTVLKQDQKFAAADQTGSIGALSKAAGIFDFGPSLAESGIKVATVNDEVDFANYQDSGPEADRPGSVESYPLPANRLADLRSRQARYGQSESNGQPLSADRSRQTGEQPADNPTLDASEGKAIDPLKLSKFDLNSAQSTSEALAPPARGLGVGNSSETSSATLSSKRSEVKNASIHVVDASEGTALDPLKLSKFDLDSPQSTTDALTPPAKGLLARGSSLSVTKNLITASGGRPAGRSVDASEGTAIDPLKNRSFDLNTAKSTEEALAKPKKLMLASAANAKLIIDAASKSNENQQKIVAIGAGENNGSHSDPTIAPRTITVDASEGTAIDPLNDHSFDLNSAKSTVDVLAAPKSVKIANFSASKAEVTKSLPAKIDALNVQSQTAGGTASGQAQKKNVNENKEMGAKIRVESLPELQQADSLSQVAPKSVETAPVRELAALSTNLIAAAEATTTKPQMPVGRLSFAQDVTALAHPKPLGAGRVDGPQPLAKWHPVIPIIRTGSNAKTGAVQTAATEQTKTDADVSMVTNPPAQMHPKDTAGSNRSQPLKLAKSASKKSGMPANGTDDPEAVSQPGADSALDVNEEPKPTPPAKTKAKKHVLAKPTVVEDPEAVSQPGADSALDVNEEPKPTPPAKTKAKKHVLA